MTFMFSIAFLVFLGLYVKVMPAPSPSEEMKYFIFVDAGSTGTRAYLYQLPRNYKLFQDQFFITSLPFPIKERPFTSDPSGTFPIEEYVWSVTKDLLEKINEDWSLRRNGPIPLYIFGTGGLRSLSPVDQNKITEKLNEELTNYNGFNIDGVHFKVISGQEEALYAWITANYLDKKLNKELTVGVSEMGGSSLQLAYQVKDVKGSPENIVHLKLGSGHNYHVFTASFDDYGSDSVYNKYVQALSNQLKDEEASYCFPPGFNFTEEQSTKSVSKDPQGNFENCSRSLKSILDLNCIQAQCSINGKSLPPFDANMKIYGLASFYYITNDFKAYDEDNKLNKSKFVDEATKYCSTQWEEIQKMTKIRYREKTCLKASYINLLLEKGFNITQGAEFYTVQNVNDLKVSWTLGALLHALNAED